MCHQRRSGPVWLASRCGGLASRFRQGRRCHGDRVARPSGRRRSGSPTAQESGANAAPRGGSSGGNELGGDEIEHHGRRVVVAKRVRYLPDGRGHRSPAAPVVQRAVDTVGQQPSRKDDAPRVHRIVGLEALRQPQDRLPVGPHRCAVSHHRRERRPPLDAIGVGDDLTKAASQPLPVAGGAQLANAQRGCRA